ncbi:hypothetical protein F2Q70_00033982 [Brassica cretica]|uniref:Sialate O-acetylesterase domain-containing protein n=1 Tax=Brassica cretica TaxID=69181 RepID=A0A8S9JZZ6_BRACR|nr:hypothetical protein F2Q70_00033982 [Brassica cretica]
MEGRATTTSAAESPEIQYHPPNPPNQIFILSGQSNMAGRGGVIKDHHLNRWVWDKVVPSECSPDSSILRLRADLRWEEAREPLHADIDTGKVCGVGPGMAFANAWILANSFVTGTIAEASGKKKHGLKHRSKEVIKSLTPRQCS